MVSRGIRKTECVRGVQYSPVMTISNNYLPLLEKVQETYGGRIRLEGAMHNVYALYFSATEMRSILPLILKHLIVKEKQARVMIEFLKRKEISGPRNVSDEDFKFYETCYLRLKELKKIRFYYDWSPKPIKNPLCPQCGARFTVFSNVPHKKYCSFECKRKAGFVRQVQTNQAKRLSIVPQEN